MLNRSEVKRDMKEDGGVTFTVGTMGRSEQTIGIPGHVSPDRNRCILGSGTEENGQGLASCLD